MKLKEKTQDLFIFILFLLGMAVCIAIGILTIIFFISIGWVIAGWIIGTIIISFYIFFTIWVIMSYRSM